MLKHKVKVAGSNNYYKEQGVNISCLSSNKAFITNKSVDCGGWPDSMRKERERVRKITV